jgi:hypothetical protein
MFLLLSSLAMSQVPSADVIQNKSRAELKTFLENLSASDLTKALESVDIPTLKVGLEVVDAATLKVALEKIKPATLKNGLINIDRPTLRIAVRIIDQATLRTGLIAVDAPTLKVALESMDVATLKVAVESLDRATLKVALTDTHDKIDEATFAVAFRVVDDPTRVEMKKLRGEPGDGPLSEANRAKESLKEQFEKKIRIGNQGSTEITRFDYDREGKKLVFEVKFIAKHSYGTGLPTIRATFTISGTVDLANPGDSEFCVEYPANFRVLTGRSKDCVTGKEIVAALSGG